MIGCDGHHRKTRLSDQFDGFLDAEEAFFCCFVHPDDEHSGVMLISIAEKSFRKHIIGDYLTIFGI